MTHRKKIPYAVSAAFALLLASVGFSEPPRAARPVGTLPTSTMTTDSPQAAQVKTEIERLVAAAASSQFDLLDTIYHDDMRIYLFDENLQLHVNDKPGFIRHVKESVGKATTPNIWARFHRVEANETNGHVLISRKVNLTGREQIVTLSIDLVFQDGRWQITREVIFMRSDSNSADSGGPNP